VNVDVDVLWGNAELRRKTAAQHFAEDLDLRLRVALDLQRNLEIFCWLDAAVC